MKAVLDTNVIVSASLSIVRNKLDSPNLAVVNGIFVGAFTHVTSEPLLFEMAEVLQCPKFGLSGAFVIDMIRQVARASEIVPIRGLSMGCRDPKDDKFVEASVNGRVNALVTRDPDLYDRRTRYGLEKRGIEIVSASAFLRSLDITVEGTLHLIEGFSSTADPEDSGAVGT